MLQKRRSPIFSAAVKCVLLAAFLAVGAAGCTGKPSPTPTETQAEEPDELDLAGIDAYDKANKDFIASFKGVLTKYDVDTESEYASLEFYDIYITREYVNMESNSMRELIVRYRAQLDELDRPSLFTRTYKMEERLYSDYKETYDRYDTVEEFLAYLYENRGAFENKENMIDPKLNEHVAKLADGSYIHFTAEDFEDYRNSLPE